MPIEIYVYGKPGCSLCDEAIELVDEVNVDSRFVIVRCNILESVELFERYRYRIPVLVIEGVERLELRFTLEDLQEVLRSL